MSDNPRIDELKRRVQQDPSSIAFAALADEYRRAGLFHDAVETCRAGLQRHPAYVSARVTLGRALMELGEFQEAAEHLEQRPASLPRADDHDLGHRRPLGGTTRARLARAPGVGPRSLRLPTVDPVRTVGARDGRGARTTRTRE